MIDTVPEMGEMGSVDLAFGLEINNMSVIGSH